jgi:hypothetical protein
MVLQQKTQRPVQFEITPLTPEAVAAWIKSAALRPDDYLFPSRLHASLRLGTRQYARIVDGWVKEVGLDPAGYGTHSIRRTKPTLIYRRTRNLRAVQLLLGHTKLEGTVRYLGIEVDDARRSPSKRKSDAAPAGALPIGRLSANSGQSLTPPAGRVIQKAPVKTSMLRRAVPRFANKDLYKDCRVDPCDVFAELLDKWKQGSWVAPIYAGPWLELAVNRVSKALIHRIRPVMFPNRPRCCDRIWLTNNLCREWDVKPVGRFRIQRVVSV